MGNKAVRRWSLTSLGVHWSLSKASLIPSKSSSMGAPEPTDSIDWLHSKTMSHPAFKAAKAASV